MHSKLGAPMKLPYEDGLDLRLSHINLTKWGAECEYKLPFSNNKVVLRAHQVETDKLMSVRPTKRPTQEIVQQGKWECMPAALAMLTGHSLFTIKRLMGKYGWRNDNAGAPWEAVLPAIRDLGFDIVWLNKKRTYMLELNEVPPCIVTVDSLNYKGRAHAVTWMEGEILDPNMDREGRRWYGAEWNPHTIGARGIEVLIKRQTKIQYLDLESMALADKDDELIQAIVEAAA